MKNKIILLLCCMLIGFGCTACTTTYQETSNYEDELTDYCAGYFTTIKEWNSSSMSYAIVYANDTKVKYMIFEGSRRFGVTPLYNADGTLQVYEEKEK